MSIPLDKLYHYLQDIINEDIIIYRWFPHGSKNLGDLHPLKPVTDPQELSLPSLIAHDQEPLDYEYTESQCYVDPVPEWVNPETYNMFISQLPSLRCHSNLWNVYEKLLLCHSEKNSKELDKFSSHFVGVYYWSHALIARDWFRYAAHDPALCNDLSQYKYDFLIYNRAWSGSREYRLKFVDLLVKHNLQNCALTSFAAVDSDLHYRDHKFKNQDFTITNFDLESILPENKFAASASADYIATEYNQCGIEIVLETLFDDQRIHLTEKILRPIACGKPFMLVSTPGAVQYLRDYGFKTFTGLIDESYDQVSDPLSRLECIVKEMQRIHNLPEVDKLELFNKLNCIAEYNKSLFFSEQWQDSIVNEFVTNFNSALTELKTYNTGKMLEQVKNVITAQGFVQKIQIAYSSA